MIAGRPVAFIGCAVKHSIFVEFGTKRHFVAPRNRKALRWIAKGKGSRGYAFSKGHWIPKQSPRPFFFPTIRKALPDLHGAIWQSVRMHLKR